jgi:hypothetical protein
LQVYDVEFGSLVEPVALAEPAVDLRVADGGEYLLARGDSTVQPVYVGVSFLDHSEGSEDSETPHIHVYKFPPAVVDAELGVEGRPLVGALGRELAFASITDVGATLARFEDRALLDPESFMPSIASYAGAQPAALLPVPGGFVVADGTIVALVPAEKDVAEVDCAAGFGPIAAMGERALVGCEEGAVLVSVNAQGPTIERIPAPRPTGAALHVDRAEIVLAHGAPTLLRFASGSALPSFETAAAVCDVLFEPGYGESLATLSEDGRLRVLDAETGEELSAVVAARPFRCADVVRPALAAIPSRAYVLDPVTRELVEFWIDAGLRELARVEVPGTPRKILATGLDLETRNLGDLSDVE